MHFHDLKTGLQMKKLRKSHKTQTGAGLLLVPVFYHNDVIVRLRYVQKSKNKFANKALYVE